MRKRCWRAGLLAAPGSVNGTDLGREAPIELFKQWAPTTWMADMSALTAKEQEWLKKL